MFLFRSQEAHARSVAKAISWRMLGSLDTFLLSWLFTQDAKAAGAIATTEIVTKILLFYGHERVWARIAFGLRPKRSRATRASREMDRNAAPFSFARAEESHPAPSTCQAKPDLL